MKKILFLALALNLVFSAPNTKDKIEQTTQNLDQIKPYLDTSNETKFDKTLFHSKSANNFNNLNYQINTSIIEPLSKVTTNKRHLLLSILST